MLHQFRETSVADKNEFSKKCRTKTAVSQSINVTTVELLQNCVCVPLSLLIFIY